MRFFILLLTLLATGHFAQAADHAREQRWADEILPAVLDGNPVWLEQADGNKFLGRSSSSATFLPHTVTPRGNSVRIAG